MHNKVAIQANPNVAYVGARTLFATMPDDTMQGVIEVGDEIHIESGSNCHLENGVYAFFWHGIFMVKRLEFMTHVILVVPASKYYMQWEIPCNETDGLLIVGRVSSNSQIRSLQ